MPALSALFISYFFIGAFLTFCEAAFLPFFIIGFGAMLFYFEDFEEWVYLTTGMYLIFSFLSFIKGDITPGIGLSLSGIIVLAFSYSRKRNIDLDTGDPISFLSCTASGTSVILGLALALVELSFWDGLDETLSEFSGFKGLLQFIIAALVAGFVICLSLASSISMYKSGKFLQESRWFNDDYKFVNKNYMKIVSLVVLVWVALSMGSIMQNWFSIFS